MPQSNNERNWLNHYFNSENTAIMTSHTHKKKEKKKEKRPTLESTALISSQYIYIKKKSTILAKLKEPPLTFLMDTSLLYKIC